MIHSTLALTVAFAPAWLAIIFGADTVTYQAFPEPHFVHVAEAHVEEPTPPTDTERAIQEIPHESPKTTEIIRHIYDRAPELGINPDQVAHTIYCESMFYNIQSGIVHEGVREPSYGLAQIHLPSHPKVSVEQALDPYFAVDWMMEHWHTVKWYGYDRATDSCTNDIAEYWN